VRRGAAWPAEPRGTSWLPTDRRSSVRFRPIRVGHAVDPATANHLPVSTAKSRPTPPLTPARPAPASSARLRLGQTTSRSWTRQATTPTPAIPAVRLPAPPPRSTTSLRSADAERTDTGRRTLDTWTLGRPHGHWTPVAWTGTRGHWTLAPDTGPRTLAEDADRVTTARPTPGLSWGHHVERPRAGRRPMLLGTAPAALGSPCRLGRKVTCRREAASRTTRRLLGRSRPPAAGCVARRTSTVAA
jgi:hypothetical protein